MLSKGILVNVGRIFCVCDGLAGCSWRCASTSGPPSKLSDSRKTQTQVATDVKGELQPQKKFSLFEREGAPMSMNIPNPRGIENYDPKMSIQEMVDSLPGVVKQQTEMVRKEIGKLTFRLDKKELEEGMGYLRQGETRKEYVFDTPEALQLWKTGCDSDWNDGYSKCELLLTDRKTALFRGTLSTQIVKDGINERAGWATMKLNDTRSFLRKKYFTRWENFSHLLIKCRGDGRSYKVMLHCPGGIDVTWGDSFSYPLHTHGGPYWQYEKIPFSKFFHTVQGRIQDRQFRVNCKQVSSMGIVLMDRMDGEFSLEIEFIGVTHDRSHLEKFAYESYTLPIFNPSGM